VAWVALWRAFHQTRKYSFLMITPKLLDFSPFFFLISSPLGTADFLMLLKLPGDGYSLLCSKKQPLRHRHQSLNIVFTGVFVWGGVEILQVLNLVRNRVLNSCRIWSTTQLHPHPPPHPSHPLSVYSVLWEGEVEVGEVREKVE
jgi:hypothetical protein